MKIRHKWIHADFYAMSHDHVVNVAPKEGGMKAKTIQEKILEGLAEILWDSDRPPSVPTWANISQSTHEHCQMERSNTLIDARYILKYLHSQGVVIKVNKELPITKVEYQDDIPIVNRTQQDMLKAGYVAVEPLIEEQGEGEI